MISITKQVQDRINAEGERDYPNETCGFLLGRIERNDVRESDDIIPVVNARETEEAYHRFVILPQDFLKAEHEALAKNKNIIGIYHSHPDHPPIPSDYDLEHGLPFYSYLILSVKDGKADKLTSWRLENDRSGFAAEELKV
ncbi:MAG: M67 family metallopeptidase [Clostridiales Family XIII bacterium]|jgi:proteasome lid subunit RPN8/RPN11|nr:M67 family metallopeptidase [Clostridiales Family XIII bacterium]